MNIYMIRHGETDWNVNRRLQGHSDIELNKNGRDLAYVTAKALREIPFDAAYSSPLKRAWETASILIGDRDIPIFEEERLKEIGFGEFEGLICKKEGYNIPDPDFMHFFHSPEQYHPPKGGESIEELCNRTSSFLKELIQNKSYENSNILIATHGAAIRALLYGISFSDKSEFWKGGVHKNCAVTQLESYDGTIILKEEGKVYS